MSNTYLKLININIVVIHMIFFSKQIIKLKINITKLNIGFIWDDYYTYKIDNFKQKKYIHCLIFSIQIFVNKTIVFVPNFQSKFIKND